MTKISEQKDSYRMDKLLYPLVGSITGLQCLLSQQIHIFSQLFKVVSRLHSFRVGHKPKTNFESQINNVVGLVSSFNTKSLKNEKGIYLLRKPWLGEVSINALQ